MDFINYKEAREKISKLLGQWSEEDTRTKENRKFRYVELDEEEERTKGNLQPDEKYIPLKLADTNIRREQASYVAYLTQARRQAIFNCVEIPDLPTEELEKDFTTKCRYDGWQIPFFKSVDCTPMHGWSCFEVIYDQTKPGRFAVEYIQHEDLVFPLDCEDLQGQEFIIRRYTLTALQLREFKTSGRFSSSQVSKILKDFEKEDNSKNNYCIEKVFFKRDGVVFVAWSASKEDCTDWLAAPRQLNLGIYKNINIDPNTGEQSVVDEPITEYPIFKFDYLISENDEIFKSKGRIDLDRSLQEASSSLMSSFVTAHRRAANVYANMDNPMGGVGRDPLQTDIKLSPGVVMDSAIKFWQLTPPTPAMLQAIQALAIQNQSETSQPNFAVQNRKDSEKTATEIKAATMTSTMLTAVQVALLSAVMKGIYTLCWKIYRSQVLAGIVKTPTKMEYFKYTYILKPAGDQDVIERQEKLQKFMQFWPVFAQTPFAQGKVGELFFRKFISLAFPDEADDIFQAMDEQDMTKKLLASMQQVIQLMIPFVLKDPEGQQMIAPYMGQLQQMNQVVTQLLYGQQGTPGGSPTPRGMASPPNNNQANGASPETAQSILG